MAKAFTFPIRAGIDAAAVLDRARSEARRTGIVLEGDDAGGRFRGTAEGTYSVEGDTLHVEVTSKPSFVPWGMIETALRKVFG